MKGTLRDHCFRKTSAWRTLASRSIALHCVGVEGDDVLDEEDCLPQLALVVDDFHCLLALVELEVEVELDELVKELVELDVAHAVGSSSLGFLLEGLPLDCAVRDCGWRWLDLILEGHVVPQALALLVVVVEDVEPRRLVVLGVDALALSLHVGVVVAILVLAHRPLEFDVVGALESRCLVGD